MEKVARVRLCTNDCLNPETGKQFQKADVETKDTQLNVALSQRAQAVRHEIRPGLHVASIRTSTVASLARVPLHICFAGEISHYVIDLSSQTKTAC